MKIEDLKDILYNGFLGVQKIKGIPNKTKHRMLWEMYGMNGENQLNWEVIGLTEMAYNKIMENDFKLPEGKRENKINRSHRIDRIKTSLEMLEKTNWTKESWWKFYRKRDKCVLATGTENKSKEKIVIKYKVPKRKDRLFRSKNYNARIGAEEKKFLMEVA